MRPTPQVSAKQIGTGRKQPPNTDSPTKVILMKRPQQSRDFPADFSADHSNDGSTETIGTTTENPNASNASAANGTIDLNDNSYFIQYHPEAAGKLSQHNSTYSVSGRCLSIVASRMIYWSRYAQHRFQGKLWYWKNQTELSEETGFSIKQVNRALKVLVELGIILREKFHKHYYRQVYFYHIPISPHTQELKAPSRTTSTRSRSTNSSRSSSGGSQHQQQFHRRSGGAVARHEAVVFSSSSAPAAIGAPAPGAGGSAAPKTTSTIHKGKGFGSMGTKCPIQSKESPTPIKQTFLNIMQRCNAMQERMKNERGEVFANLQ